MPQSSADSVLKALRAFGLSFPGVHTKAPWPDHLDLAVDNKTFAYLSVEGEPLSISCKLPQSNTTALLLPFVEPTAYGLGASGWVTAKFSALHKPSLDTLKAWIDESYRAQAPKRLVARLSGQAVAQPTPSKSETIKSSRPKKANKTKALPTKKPKTAKSATVKQADIKKVGAKKADVKKVSAKTTAVAKSRAAKTSKPKSKRSS
jgi:hypothetical protein